MQFYRRQFVSLRFRDGGTFFQAQENMSAFCTRSGHHGKSSSHPDDTSTDSIFIQIRVHSMAEVDLPDLSGTPTPLVTRGVGPTTTTEFARDPSYRPAEVR